MRLTLAAVLLFTATALAQKSSDFPFKVSQTKLAIDKGKVVAGRVTEFPVDAAYRIKSEYPVSAALVPHQSLQRIRNEKDLKSYSCFAEESTDIAFQCATHAAVLVIIDSRKKNQNVPIDISYANRDFQAAIYHAANDKEKNDRNAVLVLIYVEKKKS